MYAALAVSLPVLQNVDEAIRWANEFVARIEDARLARAVPAWGKRAAGTGPVYLFCLAMQSKHLESPLASFRDPRKRPAPPRKP